MAWFWGMERYQVNSRCLLIHYQFLKLRRYHIKSGFLVSLETLEDLRMHDARLSARPTPVLQASLWPKGDF